MRLGEDPDEYVIQRVHEAVAEDERSAELNLDIQIANKELFLRGVVPNDARRQAVTQVVKEILPDDVVHNDLEVENLTEPGSPERLS
jgi:osmotically-inducible protein OsmY